MIWLIASLCFFVVVVIIVIVIVHVIIVAFVVIYVCFISHCIRLATGMNAELVVASLPACSQRIVVNCLFMYVCVCVCVCMYE